MEHVALVGCVGGSRRCTPKFLARLFRVREQRVLAILALKAIEFQEDWDRAEEEAQEMRALQQQCIEAGSFKPAGIDLELGACDTSPCVYVRSFHIHAQDFVSAPAFRVCC